MKITYTRLDGTVEMVDIDHLQAENRALKAELEAERESHLKVSRALANAVAEASAFKKLAAKWGNDSADLEKAREERDKWFGQSWVDGAALARARALLTEIRDGGYYVQKISAFLDPRRDESEPPGQDERCNCPHPDEGHFYECPTRRDEARRCPCLQWEPEVRGSRSFHVPGCEYAPARDEARGAAECGECEPDNPCPEHSCCPYRGHGNGKRLHADWCTRAAPTEPAVYDGAGRKQDWTFIKTDDKCRCFEDWSADPDVHATYFVHKPECPRK